MELIDKAALVAEIEGLKRNTFTNFDEGVNAAAQILLDFLDTLEVKEVDLDEEIDKWYDTAPNEFEKIHFEHIENCARHFFNFGLKAREGNE